MTITAAFPTDAELDARVAKGMACLDLAYPNWLRAVARDALDIAFTDHCVAGQVGEGTSSDERFETALDIMGLGTADGAVMHGFTIRWDEQKVRQAEVGDDPSEVYAPLTAAWHRAIDQRLKEQPA